MLLLPLFYAFTGLRARIEVGGRRAVWFYSAIVIVVAVTGKLGGSMFAGRVFDHGSDGPGHHVYDYSADGVGLPGSPDPHVRFSPDLLLFFPPEKEYS